MTYRNGLSSTTRAVRAAIATDREHGAVVPPIHLSSTFAFEGFNRPRAYDYTRSGNPTRSQLGRALADLEGGAWDAYIWVDNADALYAEFKSQGVQIVRAICDQEYGCRDFDVEDCNGYRLCFGQVMDE